MKTFSVLLALACLGVAFMLIGNTADAEPFEFRVQGTSGVAILSTTADQVTFVLIDLANGAGIPNIPVNFDAAGVAISSYNGVSAAGSTQANTDADGIIEVSITVDPNAPAAYLRATPHPRSTYAVDATAYFRAYDPPPKPVKLVILPPQETAKPALPSTLDPAWPDPTWVDYCADADGERSLNLRPEPIHLADGPRKTQNATAQTYQESVGNLFTAVIEIRDVKDLSAWQMDVAFNPQILRALAVKPGQFLAQGDYVPFFTSGVIDNGTGVISGISQARVGRIANQTPPPANSLASPSPPGVSTSEGHAGILLCIDFQVLEFAEESLGLHNVQLSNSKGERLSYYATINPIVVTHRFPAEDVNRDRVVGIQDLIVVAGSLGEANPINPRADVNDDGIVNALDLIQVSSHASWAKAVSPALAREPNAFVGPAAPILVGNPADITPGIIRGWIDLAQVEDDGSAIFDLGIAKLERLLQATVPEETKLLLNYPNPFNPETWIPYQLAKSTDVTVSIYSVNGALVRTLALGHQAAGVYQSKSQAAYWDGRNELGERVASGVYFYTLTAGDFSATGKMLVRK